MGEEAVPSAGPLQSAANKWSVLTCVLLGSFTVILNNSMLNVSIPSFMKLFHIGASEAQWVITGFMLPMMIMMTISGYLSDVLGQKTAYIAGMLLFLAGSAFGAMAWSFHSIVGFRIVQGLGAGLVMPLGITIIFHNFPERERGLATGISGIASMAAPAVGPTLGGMVLQVSSWHTLFLLNIPTGVICLTATLFCLKGRRLRVRVPFDRLGFAGIAVGMTCLMLGMNRLPQGLGGATLPLICAGVGGLAFFIWNELRAEKPLIDLSIFRFPAFTVSAVLSAITASSMFAGVLLIPLLMQEVLQYSAMTTGLILLPQALMMGIAMTVGGRIVDRHGAQLILPFGLLLAACFSLVLGWTAGTTGLAALIVLLSIRGFGLGSIHTPVMTAGLNALPVSQVSRAMSILQIVGQISGAVTIVLLSMFFEARRSLYQLQMPAEAAGILAVQQMFIGLGALALCILPVALRLMGKRRALRAVPPAG